MKKRSDTIRNFSISFPKELANEVERMAAGEGRTISEFFREAFRTYKSHRLRAALTDLRMRSQASGDDSLEDLSRFGLEEKEQEKKRGRKR